MKPRYVRCSKNHRDIWYAAEDNMDWCPLCIRQDALTRWEAA